MIAINFYFFIHLFTGALAFSTFFLRLILVNWYVLEKTNSSFMVGLLASIPILIQPFAAPIGGILADKYSRKVILFITRMIEASGFILLAISINLDISPLILIGVLSGIVGISGAIGGPSWRNMLVDIVGRERIARGNALTELANGIVNAIVPALAALLLTIYTVSQLFWSLPLISYTSALLILILVIKLPPQEKNIDESSRNSSMKDSFIYAFNDSRIRPILILGSSTLIWGITQPLIPVYCRDVLNLDGVGYSLVTSANFVGAIFGSFLLIAYGSRLATGKFMSSFIMLFSIFMYLFFLVKNPFIAAFFLFTSNMFITIWIACVFTSLQLLPDKKYMGRVVSLFFSMFGLIGVGFILGGYLGDRIGLNLTVLVSVLVIIILNLAVLFSSSSYRNMRVDS